VLSAIAGTWVYGFSASGCRIESPPINRWVE
jgi:hypothetical protein